ARSTWKTADRRQDGNAGAEDMGLAALVGQRDAEAEERVPPSHGFDDPESPDALAPSPARLTPSHPDVVAVAVETLRQEVLHGRTCTCAACLTERTGDRDAFLRRILPFSADAYPDEAADRDMERTPLRVEKLYPWWDFWSVKQERPDDVIDGPAGACGHGFGRWLARAIGGLLPGDFKVVGGAGAKIGKTHLIGQMIEGLA